MDPTKVPMPPPVVPLSAVPTPAKPAPLPVPAAFPNDPGKLAHKMLQEQIDSISLWADLNHREAKWETFWFWGLKVPVIVSSAGYGLLFNLSQGWPLAFAGAVSATCVLIDGIYRPGNLRNFHHRAYFELSMLADDLTDQWKAALLKSDDLNSVAARLIEDARKRKAMISGYLADAEATLGKDAVSLKPKP